MVEITYLGDKFRSFHTRKGNHFGWNKGDTHEVEDEGILEKIKDSKLFVEKERIGPKGNRGRVKTGIRHPKRLGRPPKSKGKSKEEVKVPKSVMDKVKKPKGLKKKKGIGIDLDGDGKVDVVVGGD